MSILDAITSIASGGIASGVASAMKVAEAIAERAKNGQLIDAGEARAHAANLKAIHDQLAVFKRVADRIDTDPDFARRVRAEFEDDD